MTPIVSQKYDKRRGRAYWVLRYVPPGSDARRDAGLPDCKDEHDAAFWLKYALVELAAGRDPFPEHLTIEKWKTDYLAQCVAENQDTTLRDKRQRIGLWVRWMAAHFPAVKYIGRLKVEHLDAYKADRSRASNSWAKELVYVKHAVGWAEARGYVKENPFRVFKFSIPQAPEKKAYELEVVATFLQAAEPAELPLFQFGFVTGARPSETCRITPRMVNLRGAFVTWSKRTKNKKPAIKSYHHSADLVDFFEKVIGVMYLFARLRGLPPPQDEPIFRNREGGALTTRTYRSAVYRCSAAAGFCTLDTQLSKEERHGKKPHGRVVAGEPIYPYAIRHTFGTELNARTGLDVDPGAAQLAMSHSNRNQMATYDHVNVKRLRGAFETIDVDALARGEKPKKADVVPMKGRGRT